jgi:hypothetical protein
LIGTLQPNQFIAYLADAEGRPICVVDVNDRDDGAGRKFDLHFDGPTSEARAATAMIENMKDAINMIVRARNQS